MNNAPLDSLGWIEIIVTGAIALGLGFWQLWSINREIAKDKAQSPSSLEER
jgi:hypothetical protein